MAQTQAGLDGEINTTLISGSDITAAQLRQVLHDMNAAIFQNTVTGFAGPSNSVGLVASAGVATTALRSDAVLAINQNMAPTWTAPHAFANSTPSSSSTTGAVTVAGGVGIVGALFVGQTINATGSIYIGSGNAQAAQRVTGTVSGTVSTTDIGIVLPTGAAVVDVRAYTTVAFLCTGTLTLTAGSAAGTAGYMAAQSIQALGVYDLLLNGTPASAALLGSIPSGSPPGSPNFWIRLTQTGTPSAVGSTIIVVQYMVP